MKQQSTRIVLLTTMGLSALFSSYAQDSSPNQFQKNAKVTIVEKSCPDDDPSCFGKISYSDGSIYEGEIVNGNRVGNGKLEYPNGSIIEGEWKNDDIEGDGSLTFANGDEYFGSPTKRRRDRRIFKHLRHSE